MTEARTTPESGTGAVVLYDGNCGLCDGLVRWLLDRDRKDRLKYASLQSDAAGRLLTQRGVELAALPDSVVLVDEAGVHVRSAAALGIAGLLGYPWRASGVFRVVPRPLRDWVYDVVARNRKRWFGTVETCIMPTPELRERFLDMGER